MQNIRYIAYYFDNINNINYDKWHTMLDQKEKPTKIVIFINEFD